MSEQISEQTKPSDLMRWGPIVLLIVLAGAVYLHGLNNEFVFDDRSTVVDNEHIRTLWPLSVPMDAPEQSPLVDRPVSSVSLAANYALTGGAAWGFRLGNLILHTLTALLLFGVLRRTFTMASMRDRFGGSATGLATAVAALWVVHPLNTEAVVYVAQRTELMMAFCFMLTLYSAIRWWTEADKSQAGGWLGAAVLACALGMGSKETMAVAPLVVLLYDRTFVSGSFRETVARHGALYACLFATWIILAFLLMTGASRDQSVGFNLGMSSWDYLRIQAGVLVRYLQLVFVPYPLLLHYHWPVPTSVTGWLPQGVAILALVGVTLWAMVRRPRWGVVGAWFFLLLGPSSSIAPIVTEVAAERRMYLPLMAVITALVVGAYLLLGRRGAPVAAPAEADTDTDTDTDPGAETDAAVVASPAAAALGGMMRLGVGLTAVLVAALLVTSFVRVGTWRTQESIWLDTIAKEPADAIALNNLGAVYLEANPPRVKDAVGAMKRAMELDRSEREALGADNVPLYMKRVHTLPLLGLGVVARNLGDMASAEAYFRQGLKINPQDAKLYVHLGRVYQFRGQSQQAKALFRKSIELDDRASTRFNLAVVHEALKEYADAEREYKRAIELGDLSAAHDRLGLLYFRQGRLADAELQYQQAIATEPESVSAHMHMGELRIARRQSMEAMAEYMIVLKLEPENAEAHFRAALAFVELGEMQRALVHMQNAVKYDPKDPVKWVSAGNLMMKVGRPDGAVVAYGEALKLQPGVATTHDSLGQALAATGKLDAAIEQFNKAIELDKTSAAFHDNLGVALARQKKFEPAAAAFRQAIALDPKYELATKHLDAVLKDLAKPAVDPKAPTVDPSKPAPPKPSGDAPTPDPATPKAATPTPDAPAPAPGK
ncbi:MAG: tetratricopeptide repeat protein [Phycisphaera sp.]|nr:tetratricopeptide repeat protein [Phycisphaera sp.]